jgi:DNA mismatch endonuclease (patch repair protein)
MSRIKGKDTKLEVAVRKELFSRGYRFRKNDKRYPGKPDIVLPKYRTVIFVHGCFWHRHMGCNNATMPKTRTEWWSEKLKKNVINDICNQQRLEELGWKVIVVWECELEKNLSKTIDNVEEILKMKN